MSGTLHQQNILSDRYGNSPEFFPYIENKPLSGHFRRNTLLYKGSTDRKQGNTSKDLYRAKISPGQKTGLLQEKCTIIDDFPRRFHVEAPFPQEHAVCRPTSSTCRWMKFPWPTSSAHAMPIHLPTCMSSVCRTVEALYSQYHRGTSSMAAREGISFLYVPLVPRYYSLQ